MSKRCQMSDFEISFCELEKRSPKSQIELAWMFLLHRSTFSSAKKISAFVHQPLEDTAEPTWKQPSTFVYCYLRWRKLVSNIWLSADPSGDLSWIKQWCHSVLKIWASWMTSWGRVLLFQAEGISLSLAWVKYHRDWVVNWKVLIQGSEFSKIKKTIASKL